MLFRGIMSFALLSIGASKVVRLPSEIEKCSLSDPKGNDCMAKSLTKAISVFKDGNKDLGIPVLEPLEIKKIEIGAEPGKSVNLNQIYENVKMHGLSGTKFVNFSGLNNTNCQWKFEAHTPMTTMESDYRLTGQVLVFPINAFGKSNVTLYNVVNHQTVDCERYTKKGKTYEKLKNFQMNMSVEKCVFQFDNLFPGNDQISSELGKTINENSLEIFEEVKHGFEKVLSQFYETGANNLLSKIPLDELFLP